MIQAVHPATTSALISLISKTWENISSSAAHWTMKSALVAAVSAFTSFDCRPSANDEYFWWQVAEYSYDTFMIRSRTRA
jgi:hypothetical protein